jgi:hypothetical protein
MNAARIAGIVLIVAGIAGLGWKEFSYSRETTQAKLGPIELRVSDRRTVAVPTWLSIGAIAAGAALLLVRRK